MTATESGFEYRQGLDTWILFWMDKMDLEVSWYVEEFLVNSFTNCHFSGVHCWLFSACRRVGFEGICCFHFQGSSNLGFTTFPFTVDQDFSVNPIHFPWFSLATIHTTRWYGQAASLCSPTERHLRHDSFNPEGRWNIFLRNFGANLRNWRISTVAVQFGLKCVWHVRVRTSWIFETTSDVGIYTSYAT
jgi:hypothetical protein